MLNNVNKILQLYTKDEDMQQLLDILRGIESDKKKYEINSAELQNELDIEIEREKETRIREKVVNFARLLAGNDEYAFNIIRDNMFKRMYKTEVNNVSAPSKTPNLREKKKINKTKNYEKNKRIEKVLK